MADADDRTPEAVRREIESEREALARSLERLRADVGEVTNVTERLRAALPAAAGGALAAGFVLAGGIGATMRYLARRGREGRGRTRARAGSFELVDRK